LLSYWEKQQWFSKLDLVVVGSGLVGLSAALHFKEQHPKARVLILERGVLPQGASTKNAGFACFGSPSEILDDLQLESESLVFERVAARYRGLVYLREWLGDEALEYRGYGGTELFRPSDQSIQAAVKDQLPYLNAMLRSELKGDPYAWSPERSASFGLRRFNAAVWITQEGQINTGKLMTALLDKAHRVGIKVLNGLEVRSLEDRGLQVEMETPLGVIAADRCMVCVNGFAQKLLPQFQVQPARAQVLITETIPQMALQGNFHVDRGYYYFRNVDGRILLGGGRQLNRTAETTFAQHTTAALQRHLKDFLRNHIHPSVAVADQWAGTMGLGPNNERQVLLQNPSPRLGIAVRLGGMGIALGAALGRDLAHRMT
jgi:glycine/D-amino acid oxidase-like deaminating enzyme